MRKGWARLALAAGLLWASTAWAVGPHSVVQVMDGGFGNPYNNWSISSGIVWNGALYLGTGGIPILPLGAEIWRSFDGTNFEPAALAGISNDKYNLFIISMAEFQGQLYAGTINPVIGGRIYRTSNGTNWTSVNTPGFGTACNAAMTAMIEFLGQLYVGTWSVCSGSEVWRTSNGTTWERVATGGFGEGLFNSDVATWAVHDGILYGNVENLTTGMRVVRTTNGTSWQIIATGGFGNRFNSNGEGLVLFDGQLTIGTWNSGGTEVFRSPPPGDNFQPWTSPGDLNSHYIKTRFDLDGAYLIAASDNEAVGEGAGVFRRWGAGDWEPVIEGGFGDPLTRAIPTTVKFEGRVYLGTYNQQSGAEVWRLDPPADDPDSDAVSTAADNCPDDFNPDQADCNQNGVGDVCDPVGGGPVEICGDGIDNDCNGEIDDGCGCTDGDIDGYAIEGGGCGLVDCDDTDPDVNPGSPEQCGDAVDNDCDGTIDEGCRGCGAVPATDAEDWWLSVLPLGALAWMRRRRPRED